MAERIIEANGVELCTKAFVEPTDPPILLVMGLGGSMVIRGNADPMFPLAHGEALADEITDASGRVGYGVLVAVAALPLLASARWYGRALGATGVGRSPEHLEHGRVRQSSA